MASETEVCNLALGKVGGAGEQLNGNAFLGSIDDPGKVASWCKIAFPRMRRRAIIDLAVRKCPFRSTIRFADLGSELAETPEIGQYQYAFNLPGDCLAVVRQFNESHMSDRARQGPVPVEYQWETVANSAGTGKILLTNILTNIDGDSAFIEYVIDTPSTNSFSEELIDCIATLMASEIGLMIGASGELRKDMLLQYIQLVIPNAQRANQKGFNNSARSIPDYSGGRSTRAPFPAVNTGLGTYFDAQGNRQEIV